ncbi:MAG TPA: hypothetical protein VM221_09300 [Armatimonadota bacterium]|nr:hypothetical protein [Armatimonadota bacterium]
MGYTVGLFIVGVALVGATAIPQFWHRSPAHRAATIMRVVSFGAGLLCLAVAIRALA